jgi:hypothetical protein
MAVAKSSKGGSVRTKGISTGSVCSSGIWINTPVEVFRAFSRGSEPQESSPKTKEKFSAFGISFGAHETKISRTNNRVAIVFILIDFPFCNG